MQVNVRAAIPGVGGPVRMVLLKMLEQRGVSVARLCSGTQLQVDRLQDLNYEMPMDEFEALLVQSLRLSACPDLLLRYGQEISLASLGVLGYAFMCCANLREVLDLLLRYHRLISPTCDIRYSVGESEVCITLHKGLLNSKVTSIDSEILFSSATTALTSLLGENNLELRAQFSHAPPLYSNAYESVFGDNIEFQSAINSLYCNAELLERPLQFANPVMKQIYQQQCDALLERMEQGRYSIRVQQLLLEQPGRFPGIEQTADRLKIGSRTLRRRLAGENTTYKQLVQEVRCQLAEEYLRSSPLSIQEIADMLDYSDVANFRRAFIAWRGISPAKFRGHK